jgi:hypothetical protein
MARRCDLRLVEGQRNNFVAPEVADIPDGNGEIVARLPLDVERLVHGVREFVRAVIYAKGEELRAAFDGRRIRKIYERRVVGRCGRRGCAPGILETTAAGSSRVASRKIILVQDIGLAERSGDVGRGLSDAKRASGDHAGREAR